MAEIQSDRFAVAVILMMIPLRPFSFGRGIWVWTFDESEFSFWRAVFDPLAHHLHGQQGALELQENAYPLAWWSFPTRQATSKIKE